MPSYKTQQDLVAYIAALEDRVARLERSTVRIDTVANRTVAPTPTATKGRIIFDTAAGKLYAGDGTNWNALW